MLSIVPAAAAPRLALDGTKVSQEFRDLVAALQDADDALKIAEAEYDRKDELYFAWEKKNRQPANGNDHRAWRRWDGRFKRFTRESGHYAARSAQVEAIAAFRSAQLAVALYPSRDLNEVVHKACVSVVFDDCARRGATPHLIAQGVAFDVGTMGMAGRLVAGF